MINTDKHLAYSIQSSMQELYGITKSVDSHHYQKLQPKKKYGTYQLDKKSRIKFRELCVSHSRLKSLQVNINSLLQKIELPEYAYGSIRRKNNILNALQHVDSQYFFNVDLKDFFPNINHHQVFRMFRTNNFSPTVSRTLTQLTTYKGGLPQGPPTSPLIANLVFVSTGKRLLEVIKEHDITFTTYLDDLTFSSKRDFKFLVPKLLQIIKEDGFILNHKKISYRMNKAEVTGVIVYQNKLWPMPQMKERAKYDPRLKAYIKAIEEANRK